MVLHEKHLQFLDAHAGGHRAGDIVYTGFYVPMVIK